MTLQLSNCQSTLFNVNDFSLIAVEWKASDRMTLENYILAPQIDYSALFTRFKKAYLLSLYKINFLARGSDKNRIASRSP